MNIIRTAVFLGTSPTHHTTWTMMQKSFSVQFLGNSKSLQIILHVHNEMRFALSAMPGSRQQQRCQRAETMFDCKKKLLLQNASTPDCLNRVHSTVRLLAELVEEQFRFSPNSLLRNSSSKQYKRESLVPHTPENWLHFFLDNFLLSKL